MITQLEYILTDIIKVRVRIRILRLNILYYIINGERTYLTNKIRSDLIDRREMIE